MSANILRKREEAAEKMFANELVLEAAENTQNISVKNQDMTSKLRLQEELKRREQSKQWEHKSLTKYLEAGRIPRGLRIPLGPSFDNSNPDMIKEQAEHNLAVSANLVGIVVKYAAIDVSKILQEIDVLNTELEKETKQDMIKKYREEIDGRL
ncbi:hypothetical protein NDU88_006523 [Pleurodeles waltl]|uniref:Uncharacterized protein n=1 Tax=Pleurodeles waltl TaxID=8319 RepID=A0AAV7X0Z3_PLEWA|nr:hypothetical protein NDU88_006523 [Pleurodeles waltl]